MKKLFLLFLFPFAAICQTRCVEPLTVPNARRIMNLTTTPFGYTKNVSIYFECCYDIYLYCNSDTAQVRTFVVERFEEVKKLYKADSVIVSIDSIGVWTTPEPYPLTSSSAALLAFGDRMAITKPTADCSHLLSITPNNLGGISYLGAIGQDKRYSVSFSNIYTQYLLYPNYSWSIEVIAHEMGHMLNLQHTHNCNWLFPDGSRHPIDTCWYVEGNCDSTHSTHPITGTVQSYCHLNGSIDFTLGWGILPQNVMRQYIWDCYNAGLLKNPDLCNTPAVTLSGNTVSWGTAGIFKYRYKKKGDLLWSAAFQTLSGSVVLPLAANTYYYFQLKRKCAGVWGTYQKTTFKTL